PRPRAGELHRCAPGTADPLLIHDPPRPHLAGGENFQVSPQFILNWPWPGRWWYSASSRLPRFPARPKAAPPTINSPPLIREFDSLLSPSVGASTSSEMKWRPSP